jgi:uncharacterized protein (TIGR04222 family)
MALVAIVFAGLAPVAMGQEPNAATFPNLEAGTRVYDDTGSSLTPEQAAALERRLRDLEGVDANVIVMVRALNATPEETLDQVEALQQAWVAETGANQDNAVAILINRNPDDPKDARAGIYVGSTFDDGNVPRGEQEAIVTDALIPPLRDGNVFGSLMAGIDRLESSIINGPPQNAFEEWASGAADSWLPWAGVGAALAGLGGALAVFRTRRRILAPQQRPTTTRPGTLPPALAGALATGGPQASAVPAIILDLATRHALAIEPESEGGFMSKPKIQVRLVDPGPIRDDIEATLCSQLESRARNGVVSSKDLANVAADSKPVREATKRQMLAEGWVDPEAPGRRAVLLAIFLAAGLLAVFGVIVSIASSNGLPIIGVVALLALAVTVLVFYSRYPTLTPEGQEAALPWKAYREGLKTAAKDTSVTLDLNEVLADSIAMNLGSAMNDRLKAANEAGEALLAFTNPQGTQTTMAAFPWWIAFSSSVSTSSGSSSGVASGGGAGGGGGAAGST